MKIGIEFGKRPFFVFLLYVFSICFGCVTASPTGMSPSPGMLSQNTGASVAKAPAMNIDQLAQSLADQLDANVSLPGRKIQASENNFWQGRTKLNLPFSSALNNALSTALSRKGAVVTVQEVGDEPMILLGSYDVENVMLAVTVKIRAMGETSSKDIAFARGEIMMSKLDGSWFEPEFQRVSRTIVRILEENFPSMGFYQMDVDIPDLKPGMQGQPNLCLEKEFSRFLENAVAASSVFRPSGVTGKRIVKARMTGKYVNLENKMRFHVKVEEQSGKTLTSAVFDVDIASIPEALMKPCGSGGESVCVSYSHSPSANVSADSFAVSALIDNTNESLAAHGLSSSVCPKAKGGNSATVAVKMDVRTKMEFGRKATKATVHFQVFDSNKRVLGAFSESGVTFRPQIDDAAETIVNQIFQDENIGERLATIILGR